MQYAVRAEGLGLLEEQGQGIIPFLCGQAAMLSMDIAAQGLACTPDYVLVDGPRLPEGVKQKGNAMAVVKVCVHRTALAA